eukprot:73710-Rhodomonas_salina.1
MPLFVSTGQYIAELRNMLPARIHLGVRVRGLVLDVLIRDDIWNPDFCGLGKTRLESVQPLNPKP